MKIYAGAIAAVNSRTGEIRVKPIAFNASSIEDAENHGSNFVRMSYPASEGWGRYDVSFLEISEQLISAYLSDKDQEGDY